MQTVWNRIKVESDQALESIYWREAIWESMMAGHLHQAWQLSQQAIHALQTLERPLPPLPAQLCWPYGYQARILHEWNRLEEAQGLAEQAIAFGEQTEMLAFLPFGGSVRTQTVLSTWQHS